MSRIGGTIFFKADGVQYKAKGNWTYNLGNPKREQIVGADGVHGYSEKPQVPMIEGAITDDATLDVSLLQNLVDADVILELANGKTVAMDRSAYTADGDITTDEGEIQVRFEGFNAREV